MPGFLPQVSKDRQLKSVCYTHRSNMVKKFIARFDAFTLIELMVGVAILAFVAAIGMASFNSLSNKKALQAEADNVKQDIYVMQSRAVSGLRHQRFVILTNASYQLEEDTTGSGNYTVFQSARSFKPGIYFYGYVGKETKLEYQPNGLPDFNGAAASPFFSLTYPATGDQKDFNIDSSGVVNVVSN